MSRTVVVEELLHDGELVVFRARPATGAAVRFVSRRPVLGRAPSRGEVWEVGGTWQDHPKYGRQVAVTSAGIVRPSGQLLVLAIAQSDAFPGIGMVNARRVWEAHGEGVFELLDAGDPAPFVATLGAALAEVLVSGWREIEDAARSYRWLTQHGFPAALGQQLVAIYGQVSLPPGCEAEARQKGRVVWHLEDDPYRMLAFASWAQTDAVARRLNIAVDDERRLTGGVEAVLAKRLPEGHTWIAETGLARGAAALIQMPHAAAEQAIRIAVARRAAVAHGGGYQAPGCFAMERYVADRCQAMREGRFLPAQRRLGPPRTRAEIECLLDGFQRREGLRLTPEQRDGVWMALSEPFSLLLGGPGVGKTTVLKAVHAAADHVQRPVHQAALSGRAAQRMAETTGRPALTIASLIIRVEMGDISLDNEPLLILDESSMIDLATMYRLFRRCPPGVRLLLVGDPGQLSPIGFGLTFHILAADNSLPQARLTRVMRQTEESGIPAVCEAIRAGRIPAIDALRVPVTSGVSFVDTAPQAIADTVIDILEQMGGVAAAQIVGSVKRGAGGVFEINSRLQTLMATGRPGLNGSFFAGDPVIATRNDYQLQLMNGELGVALDNEQAGALRCRFDSGEKTIPASAVGTLDLAYAITCHKAQGSQFPRVIVPVTASRLLDRTLLLTAVSRAQEQVILVGDRAVFDAAVAAPSHPSQRLVGLGR